MTQYCFISIVYICSTQIVCFVYVRTLPVYVRITDLILFKLYLYQTICMFVCSDSERHRSLLHMNKNKAHHRKMVLWAFATSVDPDEPAHPHSLIRINTVCYHTLKIFQNYMRIVWILMKLCRFTGSSGSMLVANALGTIFPLRASNRTSYMLCSSGVQKGLSRKDELFNGLVDNQSNRKLTYRSKEEGRYVTQVLPLIVW